MICCEKLRELINAGMIVIWTGVRKTTIDIWNEEDGCAVEDLKWCPFCGTKLIANELKLESKVRLAEEGKITVKQNP